MPEANRQQSGLSVVTWLFPRGMPEPEGTFSCYSVFTWKHLMPGWIFNSWERFSKCTQGIVEVAMILWMVWFQTWRGPSGLGSWDIRDKQAHLGLNIHSSRCPLHRARSQEQADSAATTKGTHPYRNLLLMLWSELLITLTYDVSTQWTW